MLPLRPDTTETGFTLLELMVAVALFAVMGGFAYQGLAQVMDGSQQRQRVEDSLRQLQLLFVTLERDLMFASARPVRDSLGTTQPALASGANDDWLSLSSAPSPVAGRSPGPVRRIGYGMRQGDLIRRQWPVLDAGPGVEPWERILLNGVRTAQVRFYHPERGWVSHWPIGEGDILPAGLELVLRTETVGELRRVFLVY